MDVGHPDIAIRPLVRPIAVVRQLALIVIELGGQIALGDVLAQDGVPVLVPVVEIIPSVREVRLRPELTVRGQEPLPAGDELRAAFSGRFHRAFKDGEFTLSVAPGVETVEAFLQDIERGVRSMDFKGLLFFEEADAQVDISAQEMEPDPVVTAPGQVGEFEQGTVIDTEIVLAAEAHLCPAVLGFDLIALDYGQVDHTRFRPEVAGPLDDDIALEIGQTHKTLAVVILVLGESGERQ
jgi:hypothetical protein